MIVLGIWNGKLATVKKSFGGVGSLSIDTSNSTLFGFVCNL